MSRQAVKLRDEAARPTRRRIRADQRGASPDLKRVLAVIEARLFDQDFDVNRLWRESGVKKWVATPFARELGMGPGAYISKLRLEVGAALLRGTELRVFQIADALGYSASRDTFSKAFQRWSGKTPLSYRRDARAEGEPVLPGSDPAVSKLIDDVDRAYAAGDLEGARWGLAEADAVLRDRTVADLAARLGSSLHERGADRTRTGDVDNAYDDLSLARSCYAAAGELPPAIVRQQRYVPVSPHTDEALLSALCPDCRQRLVSDEGRTMRQNLRQALLLVPRDDPWFEASCDECYRVAWAALSRARLGLMSDAWKAWWLASNVDPKDRECPASRGRFIAAMAEVERLYLGDQLERKGYADMAVEDAVALGDPLLETESRLWLAAVLGALSELADGREQVNSAGEGGGSRWLSALRDRVLGLLAYYRTNYSEAMQLLKASSELYRSLDPHICGLLIIQQANVAFQMAEYGESISFNKQALTFLDDRRDCLNSYAIVPLHLTIASALLGKWEMAEDALSRCRYDRTAHSDLAANETLTRAGLELLRGRPQTSLSLFAEAGTRFERLHRLLDAAVAAIYSVEAYARLGNRARAIETAMSALAYFQSVKVTQHSLHALGKIRTLLESDVINSTAVIAKIRHLSRLHGGWLPEEHG